MNKHITPPENCVGCGICANVCSTQAINMVWSEDGFLIPDVDASRCVGCGQCVKSCIADKHNGGACIDSSVVSYASWLNNHEEHKNVASGGVFWAIASYVLSRQGIVYGVKWQNSITAVFSEVHTMSELRELRGSKYVQAVPGIVYRKVKSSLKLGKMVLFAGTACQVYALRHFLRKNYDNLICIEILCHGVPSRLLLERYVAEQEQTNGKKIQYINFRDKVNGWEKYNISCHYTDGTLKRQVFVESDFMKLFVTDLALNKSCYTCPFSRFPRQGDLTIGDFWGILKDKKLDTVMHNGVSAVFQNTEKGADILSMVERDGILTSRRCSAVSIYEGQPHTFVRKSAPPNHRRRQLLASLKVNTLRECRKRFADKYFWGPWQINRHGRLYRFAKKVMTMLLKVRKKLN